MKLDDSGNRIICSLPMREGWQEKISDTSMQAKASIKREIIKLNSFPKHRDELAESFDKLNTLGFIRRYDLLTKRER